MRDYNYRKAAKEKEKKAHLIHYNSHFCRPRSPRIKNDENGIEYIVEGGPDNRKAGLKKLASKKVRRSKNLKDGSNYKKTFALIWEWY